MGRPTHGGAPPTGRTTFGYNTLDQLITLTYPSGRLVSYEYDSEGRVTRVCTKDGSGNCLAGKTYASAFTYHPSGAPLQYTGSNGLVHQFTFDGRFRPQSITAGPLGLGYSYDAVGNVKQITDARGDTWKQTLTYDSLDRLATTTGNGVYPSSCFAYDARGNRTTACGTSYTYDGNDHLTNQSGVAFTYDAQGNLLARSSPATTFTYTPDNLIATVSGGVSYQYDADGQRVLTSGPGAAYKYAVRGPSGQLFSDADGSAVNDYIYAGRRLVAIVRITGGLSPFSGTPVDVPGQILAENFDNGGEGVAYHDATPGNTGGAYRNTDVDLEASSEGGNDVGWVDAGEWLNYTVNVTQAGDYTVQLRVASPAGGASLHVGFNGPSYGQWHAVDVPATGGWQNWTTVTAPVTLAAGVQQMTIYFDTAGQNFLWAQVGP